MRKSFLIVSMMFFIALSAVAQEARVIELLNDRGEIRVKFKKTDIEIRILQHYMSIDKVKNDTIFAYISKNQFVGFSLLNIDYTFIEPQKLSTTLKSASQVPFTYYPTFSEYGNTLNKLAVDYSTACNIVTYGRSVKNRPLRFIRINSDTTIAKPLVMLASSMHGDEIGGFVLMLRLADYLMTNYKKDALVTRLVDSLDIWIDPLLNPDGTYRNGDAVIDPVRFNANGIDLNRNYPDPDSGMTYFDALPIQPETQALIDFLQNHHFALSANFHAGAEVVNYPWDSDWALHADNDWFRDISQQYADSAQFYGRTNYFTDVSYNGITNGISWYYVIGGRQDYVTYFNQGREVTIELDETKITSESALENLWQYNYRSLLNYLDQANYGIHGEVLDSTSSKPIRAKIEVVNHDDTSSFIHSNSTSGKFYRFLKEGNYNLRISAEGYYTKDIPSVSVANRQTTYLQTKLARTDKWNVLPQIQFSKAIVFPNPAGKYFNLELSNSAQILLFGTDCKLIMNLEKESGKHIVNISSLHSNVYVLKILYKNGQVEQKAIIKN